MFKGFSDLSAGDKEILYPIVQQTPELQEQKFSVGFFDAVDAGLQRSVLYVGEASQFGIPSADHFKTMRLIEDFRKYQLLYHLHGRVQRSFHVLVYTTNSSSFVSCFERWFQYLLWNA